MRFRTSVLFVLLFTFISFTGTVSASWAYMFVVHDGKIYVVSEEQINPNQIGSKIGMVTKYSDKEGTYSGNFSNRYPRGTEYYEIVGVEITDAIAIKENEELFIKATYGGEYAGSRYNLMDFLPYIFCAVLLVIITGYLIKVRIYR